MLSGGGDTDPPMPHVPQSLLAETTKEQEGMHIFVNGVPAFFSVYI